MTRFVRWFAVTVSVAAACARGASAPLTTPAPSVLGPPPTVAAADATPPATVPRPLEPAVSPSLALLAGLMPLASTGVDQFRSTHPTYDGRGVLIGILDSGVDPGVAGLVVTSTGAPKLLDLRDFSGEGRVSLAPVTPGAAGTIPIGSRTLRGAARVGRLATAGSWYAGVFRELPLGPLPAADINGNGSNTDEFPVVVVRASDGWVVFFDSNLNGSFEDEQPLHDYRQGRETIALGRRPLTIAANFTATDGPPQLDLYFDTSGHGTHVAGIAAGRGLFDVAGFDGVAPGAQLIGLKIANNARGGISVSGSMQRALDYAAQFASQRGLPLVLNLSFGVGNELEGRAVIDSMVNAFLLAHPQVVLTVSAGNDGPGLATVGYPGSADLAVSVGALEPGAFTRAPQPGPPPPDRMGWWSSRGGVLGKPDLVAPGEAFSSVPRWNLGDEIKGGTSMSAPHVAGLVACLRSAMVQERRSAGAADLTQALRATAVPQAGATAVDQGAGVPRLEAAYRWLTAGHQGSRYIVRTAAGGSAALRRDGAAGARDTIQQFTVLHADGLRAAQFRLSSDAPWLTAPVLVTAQPRGTTITVGYDPKRLTSPGVYIGTVTARNPTDTMAGALFSLRNTIIVPYDLAAGAVADSARIIGPGRVQRYFLRVPVPGTSLRATVSLPDSDDEALVQLYDPHGRPASAAPDSLVQIGYGKSARVVIEVPADEMDAGVYELDVTNPDTRRSTATVAAELALVALGTRDDGALEVSNRGRTTAGLVARPAWVGAERQWVVQGHGAPAESLSLAVPTWATRVDVLVQMSPEQWEEFTDFALTAYDSAGQQVETTALNYARGRQTFEVPARLAGHPIILELFPAFARGDATLPWQASVRIRWFRGSGTPVGAGSAVDVVAGGRVTLPAMTPPDLAMPQGFAPLLFWRLTPVTGTAPDAVGFQAVHQP